MRMNVGVPGLSGWLGVERLPLGLTVTHRLVLGLVRVYNDALMSQVGERCRASLLALGEGDEAEPQTDAEAIIAYAEYYQNQPWYTRCWLWLTMPIGRIQMKPHPS